MSKSDGKGQHKKLTKKEQKAQNHLKLMEGKKKDSAGTNTQQSAVVAHDSNKKAA